MRSRSRPARSGRRLAISLVLAVSLAACHAASHPIAGVQAPAIDAVARLQHDIDQTIAQPELAHAYWGIVVRSLRSDETLYALNPDKLMMPGSVLKVVTLAAAAERLGWDYTYETKLVAGGVVEGGVLNGDLLVIGSGDPSLDERDGRPAHVFDTWASAIRSVGVRTITGRIVGDDRAFDHEALGAGWAWDDLAESFASGVGALQFNDNAARLTILPGVAAGAPAQVTIAPDDSGLVVQSAIVTSAAGVPATIEARRAAGSTRLELRGTVPLGGGAVGRSVSVDNPTLFFVSSLRRALVAAGIDVQGPAVGADNAADVPPGRGGATLFSGRSPTLASIASTMMKTSQNLYAETLLKTVGASFGTPTMTAARAAVRTLLEPWGVMPSALVQVDGSGLSRYNYLSPAALATILAHVDRDDRLRGPFEASLPIGGTDGTLANRLKGTPAEGNVRAKTGTLANVRALAGYVRTADGEPFVFAVIVNNYGTTPEAALSAIDAIAVRLATFRR